MGEYAPESVSADKSTSYKFLTTYSVLCRKTHNFGTLFTQDKNHVTITDLVASFIISLFKKSSRLE